MTARRGALARLIQVTISYSACSQCAGQAEGGRVDKGEGATLEIRVYAQGWAGLRRRVPGTAIYRHGAAWGHGASKPESRLSCRRLSPHQLDSVRDCVLRVAFRAVYPPGGAA